VLSFLFKHHGLEEGQIKKKLDPEENLKEHKKCALNCNTGKQVHIIGDDLENNESGSKVFSEDLNV
jgi:hypothetical protein